MVAVWTVGLQPFFRVTCPSCGPEGAWGRYTITGFNPSFGRCLCCDLLNGPTTIVWEKQLLWSASYSTVKIGMQLQPIAHWAQLTFRCGRKCKAEFVYACQKFDCEGPSTFKLVSASGDPKDPPCKKVPAEIRTDPVIDTFVGYLIFANVGLLPNYPPDPPNSPDRFFNYENSARFDFNGPNVLDYADFGSRCCQWAEQIVVFAKAIPLHPGPDCPTD